MSDGEFQVLEPFPDFLDRMIDKSREILSKLKKTNMTGVELIVQERLEQKTKHGKGIKHDYYYNPNGELADAAQALLEGDISWMPIAWNETINKKLVAKPYKDRLVIAAALIAAEIDRLNFKE